MRAAWCPRWHLEVNDFIQGVVAKMDFGVGGASRGRVSIVMFNDDDSTEVLCDFADKKCATKTAVIAAVDKEFKESKTPSGNEEKSRIDLQVRTVRVSRYESSHATRTNARAPPPTESNRTSNLRPPHPPLRAVLLHNWACKLRRTQSEVLV